MNLTNLGLSWSHGAFRTSLNVNNLFDRDPVIAGATIVGDVLGRRYSLGFELSMN